MDARTIFVKTAQGQEEIASRTRQLSPRVRAVLIMVDGRRTVAELTALTPSPSDGEAHLATLLEGGFIAVVPQEAAPEPTPVLAAQAPAPLLSADLSALKHFICATLHDAIGPDADHFAVKVEATSDLNDLLKQAEKIRDVIASVGSRKKADQYWEKLSAMLS